MSCPDEIFTFLCVSSFLLTKPTTPRTVFENILKLLQTLSIVRNVFTIVLVVLAVIFANVDCKKMIDLNLTSHVYILVIVDYAILTENDNDRHVLINNITLTFLPVYFIFYLLM